MSSTVESSAVKKQISLQRLLAALSVWAQTEIGDQGPCNRTEELTLAVHQVVITAAQGGFKIEHYPGLDLEIIKEAALKIDSNLRRHHGLSAYRYLTMNIA